MFFDLNKTTFHSTFYKRATKGQKQGKKVGNQRKIKFRTKTGSDTLTCMTNEGKKGKKLGSRTRTTSQQKKAKKIGI